MGYKSTRRQMNKVQRYGQVDRWNAHVPVGTVVSYQKDDGTIMKTKTRSRAEMLGGHTPVVWLDGVTGCVYLDRVCF